MSKIDNIISRIPQWLAIRNNEESNGYKFLSSFGVELDDVNDMLDELEESMYLSTADVDIPDYIHKIELYQLYDNTDILIAESSINTVDSIYKLFSSTTKTGMFDDSDKIFYINNYDKDTVSITIYSALLDDNGYAVIDDNGKYIKNNIVLSISQTPVQHHIWNCFDEFALLLGLERLDGETNKDLRSRIISSLATPCGSNENGLKAAIARDLGVSASKVDIKGLSDVEIYDNNNKISKQFLSYISQLSGFSELLKARWDSEIIDKDILSVEYIPRLYTDILQEIKEEHIQSGIGDLDDLKIYAPQAESNIQDFTAYVGIMADKQLKSTVYPRHDFQLKVDAKGEIPKTLFPPKNINFAIAAAEEKPVAFKVEAIEQYADNIDMTATSLQSTVTKSDTVEFVPSNKSYHYNEQIMRIHMKLYASSDKIDAPNISTMRLNYKKTDDSTGYIDIDLTQSQDGVKNDAGVLTIQKGQYHNTFATRNDFKVGGFTDENILIGSSQGIYLPPTNAQQ